MVDRNRCSLFHLASSDNLDKIFTEVIPNVVPASKHGEIDRNNNNHQRRLNRTFTLDKMTL